MKSKKYTNAQLKFLKLFEVAARYDCLYLLDFHCVALFDHDQTSLLTDDQRSELAEVAQADIFAEARQKGYQPSAKMPGVVNGQRYLC